MGSRAAATRRRRPQRASSRLRAYVARAAAPGAAAKAARRRRAAAPAPCPRRARCRHPQSTAPPAAQRTRRRQSFIRPGTSQPLRCKRRPCRDAPTPPHATAAARHISRTPLCCFARPSAPPPGRSRPSRGCLRGTCCPGPRPWTRRAPGRRCRQTPQWWAAAGGAARGGGAGGLIGVEGLLARPLHLPCCSRRRLPVRAAAAALRLHHYHRVSPGVTRPQTLCNSQSPCCR